MRELKTVLYADKFATFCMFPESFCRSFVLQMSLIHYNRRNARRLARFRKTRIGVKHNAELLL